MTRSSSPAWAASLCNASHPAALVGSMTTARSYWSFAAMGSRSGWFKKSPSYTSSCDDVRFDIASSASRDL